MKTEFKLPELGENIHSGTVGKILVSVGDYVKAGQNVIEIETDKAVAEIPCTTTGKVVEIKIREGATIKPGDVIMVIDTEAPVSQADGKDRLSPSPPMGRKPDLPETKEPPNTKVTPSANLKSAPIVNTTIVRKASPSVRTLAREYGVNLEDIPCADPSGRITAHDVEVFVRERNNAIARSTPHESVSDKGTVPIEEGIQLVDHDSWGEIVKESMNTVRSVGAERLSASWQNIPHVTHFDKADITTLEVFRKKHEAAAEATGVKLTVMAFVVKVVVEALQRYPRFNASVDMEKRELLLKKYYNIGIAVDAPHGLVVPVVRDADQKSILKISEDIALLAQKARNRKLALEELQGGTFTISNLGGIGGYGFTPIINAPEAAILGLSRSQQEAVYRNGQFEPRLMLPMSLSYDHRIIDGADAARFLRFVAEVLEEPWRVWLGL